MTETARGTEWRWFAGQLRPFARLQAASTACLIGSTLLSLADPLIVKWLIDSGLQRQDWSVVLIAVAGFFGVYVGRMLLVIGGNLTSQRLLERLMLRLRLRLVRRVQSMDAHFFDRFPVGELVRRLEQDVEQVGQVGTSLVPTLVRIVISAVVTLGIMLALDWKLTLVVVPLVPLFLALRAFFRTRLERASEAARGATGERSSFLTDMLAAVIQVQLLGAERFFRRRYGGLTTDAVRAGIGRRRMELGYFAGSFGVLTLATCAVLLAGAWEVMRGALTLGGFIAFYSYLTRLFDPLGAAVETHSALKRAGASIRRLVELEALPRALCDAPLSAGTRVSAADRIACRDVSFAYRGDVPVLRGVSLSLAPGERVALVGRSGSGKSTFAKLLVRLYDPDGGAVTVGESDARSVPLEELRRAVSLVPASPLLFRGTLRENALLGVRGVGDRDLDRYAAVACFDSVVAKFPGGWDHVVGSGGTGLSDGEKQRLGLLRSLVRDRAVLILDEATGALDPIVEGEVLARVREHARDKAVLLITHRPAAACWAERILVLEDGGLRDVGRPQEFAVHAAAVGEELYLRSAG